MSPASCTRITSFTVVSVIASNNHVLEVKSGTFDDSIKVPLRLIVYFFDSWKIVVQSYVFSKRSLLVLNIGNNQGTAALRGDHPKPKHLRVVKKTQHAAGLKIPTAFSDRFKNLW